MKQLIMLVCALLIGMLLGSLAIYMLRTPQYTVVRLTDMKAIKTNQRTGQSWIIIMGTEKGSGNFVTASIPVDN